MIRILVVDDHAPLRMGLRMILESDPEMTVVGEAATGEEAHALALTLNPDVVTMDLSMPGCGGSAATRALTDEGFAVLIVSALSTDDAVIDAVRQGAGGFVLKSSDAQRLIGAVRSVAAGEGALSDEITRKVFREVNRAPHANGASALASPPATAKVKPGSSNALHNAGLTDREWEVLRELVRGSSNADIAAHLHISPGTAKSHTSRVLAKLGVTSRTQAALLARDAGLA